jgi:hypothetical protein
MARSTFPGLRNAALEDIVLEGPIGGAREYEGMDIEFSREIWNAVSKQVPQVTFLLGVSPSSLWRRRSCYNHH